jgi:hypothetical protein
MEARESFLIQSSPFQITATECKSENLCVLITSTRAWQVEFPQQKGADPGAVRLQELPPFAVPCSPAHELRENVTINQQK